MLVDKCTKNISNRRQSTISQAAASQSKEGNHQQEKLRRLSYFLHGWPFRSWPHPKPYPDRSAFALEVVLASYSGEFVSHKECIQVMYNFLSLSLSSICTPHKIYALSKEY